MIFKQKYHTALNVTTRFILRVEYEIHKSVLCTRMRMQILALLLLSNWVINAQEIGISGVLDPLISESSGLCSESATTFWTLNDSDNPAELFLIDTSGNLLRTLKVSGVRNNDWESITRSDSHLLIGDFGNNANTRRDLQIYRIDNDQLLKDTVRPEIVSFRYEDQKVFPPINSELHFDCEAMVAFGDSIYLFTKNWTNPFDGWSFLYVVPNDTGQHIAYKVDSFDMGSISILSQVTGASIYEKQIALLGYSNIWQISFSTVPRFESVRKFGLGSLSQKEGVTHSSRSRLYITEEKVGSSANIYYLELENLNIEDLITNRELSIRVDHFTLQIESSNNNLLELSLFNLTGREVWNENLLNQSIFRKEFYHISEGVYYLRIRTQKGITERKIVLKN